MLQAILRIKTRLSYFHSEKISSGEVGGKDIFVVKYDSLGCAAT